MVISFYFNEVRFTLKDRRKLKRFIADIFTRESRTAEKLDYIFCSDPFLLELNRQFLNHDTFTDILTFDLSEPGSGIRAEIYISVDRVRDNAKKFNVPFEDELHRVLFHGALHLCGYRDKTEDEKERMRAKENENLERYLKPL
jgi:rRNA maturation RNase YbeY